MAVSARARSQIELYMYFIFSRCVIYIVTILLHVQYAYSTASLLHVILINYIVTIFYYANFVVYILVHVPHMYLAHTCNEEVLQTNPIKKSTGQCVKRRRVLSVLFLVFCWEIRLL